MASIVSPQNDRLLTPAEAAELSGFSVETIRNAYRDGSLRAFQPVKNGRVRIPLSGLSAWLTARSPEVSA